MKRVLFIYNPRAGKEKLKPFLSDTIDTFVKAGYEVVAYPTQAYLDAYKKVQNFPEDTYDLVVCSGGDGTIDEVVTGMMKRKQRLPIGYIPTGTTNDFANSLCIPTDILRAADNAVKGAPFSCDVGRFNDDVFVYVAAFGIFTDVSYETDQNLKNMLGHFAYIVEGAKRIWDIPSYQLKVTYDGGEVEGSFILGMVTNSRSVGGFRNMIGGRVVFDDGEFEVTLIRTPKNIIELQEIVSGLLMQKYDNTENLICFSTSHIEFESQGEIPWTLDGEFGGAHRNVVVDNMRKALQIMVPEEKTADLSGDTKKEKA